MAFTYSDMKAALRGLLGAKNARTSGDGGGNVPDHVARLTQRTSNYVLTRADKASTSSRIYAQTASLSQTQPLATQVIYTAEEECDLKRIRFAPHDTFFSSVSDYVTFIFVKRKATSYSLTEQVGTLAGTTANLGGDIAAGKAVSATLATTASVIDMDAGDTISVLATKTLAGQPTPAGLFTIVVEEK